MPYVSTKVEYIGSIEAHVCGQCGIHFGMPSDYLARRRKDGETFYCPNGHPRAFTETEEQRLRKNLKWYEDRLAAETADHDQTRASLRGTRGVVTKLRKRAVAGACPFGCKRHFVNLERHVASQHPGQALEGES